MGSSPERPPRTQKTQIQYQKSGIVTEWLLRTQDGQDRDHKWHGLLGLEQRSDGRFSKFFMVFNRVLIDIREGKQFSSVRLYYDSHTERITCTQ